MALGKFVLGGENGCPEAGSPEELGAASHSVCVLLISSTTLVLPEEALKKYFSFPLTTSDLVVAEII